MLRYIDHKKMGRGTHVDSHFHFSFAEYYNPKNMNFGVLRVINDDIIKPGVGFDMHSHRDMEIISYAVEGELTHEDSMGNKEILTRGQVQFMSAGTGITHSEYNFGDKDCRILQIWAFPDGKGYAPNYGSYFFPWENRIDKWMPISSHIDNKESSAPVKLHSDINIYATEISAGKSLEFNVTKDRQAYMVLVEGAATVSGISLVARDALEITEENILIEAKEKTHIVVLEMKKS